MTHIPYDPVDVIVENFTEFVKSGVLDTHLENFKKSINDRQLSVRKARDTDDFEVGDMVRFNDFCEQRICVDMLQTS